MQTYSPEKLSKYDGTKKGLPVLLSVRGMVFDVTPGKSFYGPGGPYAAFAGREVARALALMSTSPDDCSGNVSDLAPGKIEILKDWERKFQGKYQVVGTMEGSDVDLTGYVQPMVAEVSSDHDGADRKQLWCGIAAVMVAAVAFALATLVARDPSTK